MFAKFPPLSNATKVTAISHVVDMNHSLFVNYPHSLETFGVTTCIAIVVRGHYQIDQQPIQYFCGLEHWSGFVNAPKNPKETAIDLLENFYYELITQLDLEEDVTLNLSELSFIGGEKRECNLNGEVTLSGTEKEVQALQQAVADRRILEEWFNLDNCRIQWHNFLTAGTESTMISVNCNQTNYVVLDEHLVPLSLCTL